MTPIRAKIPLILLGFSSLALLLPACNTDGPEFASGDNTRIIEGTLLSAEESDTEFFLLTRGGTVNILATAIAGRNPETGDPIVDPMLVVSIGSPNPENESVCQLTFSQVLEVGESFSVFYGDGLFCTSILRNPGTLENAEYDYVLTLTGAFS